MSIGIIIIGHWDYNNWTLVKTPILNEFGISMRLAALWFNVGTTRILNTHL